jgi:predicted permease
MSALFDNLRGAVRIGRAAPGFTALIVLTLGLGIGASSALFAIVNGVLLEPLTYSQPNQLARLYARTAGVDHGPVVYLNFLDWQRDNHTFSSLAIYRNQDYNATSRTPAERWTGLMVSAGFFETLGVQPVTGRFFSATDDAVGAAPVVVISEGLATRALGGSADVLGRVIDLNGVAYTVVGVAPRSFEFYGRAPDVYTAIGQWTDPSFRDRRISVSANAIGRMKSGVTVSQAQADLDLEAVALAQAYPTADSGVGIAVVDMTVDQVGQVARPLWTLLIAVGFLLLIACANVANLLLARSIARGREFALRAALGAGRSRLVGQLLTESTVLALLGGVVGLVLASAGLRVALAAFPHALPRGGNVALDGRVVVVTLAAALVTTLLFGLVPALVASRTDLMDLLRAGGRGATSGRRRTQAVLTAAEIALSVVLVVGAGLMLRTLSALWRIDPGFTPDHAVTFSVSLPSSAATTPADTRARLRRLDEAIGAVPSVSAVSVTLGSRPLIHDSSLPFWIDGLPKPAHDNDMPQSLFYLVEAGFERAMGLRLERGRFVEARDDEHAPTVVDIDDVFARTYFPKTDPIGKRLNLTQFNVQAEVVGVVAHIRQWGLGRDPTTAIEAQFFYPFMQMPDRIMALSASAVAVVVRTTDDAAAVMPPVRRAIHDVDGRQIVYAEQTLDEVLGGSVAAPRLSMTLLTAFAGLAAMLACVGIYGVVSDLVEQRVREIGLRLALGARRTDVLRLVLGRGAVLAVSGAIVGVVFAVALSKLMSSQLFGVSSTDPLTLALAGTGLPLSALIAAYVPTRRALRVDPLTALREE